MRYLHEKQYPKQLRIRKKMYKIKIVNVIEGDPGILGICYRKKPLIKLKRRKNKAKLFRAFIHELLHSLEFEWDIEIKHKSIYKYEKALVRLLEDNY